MEKKVICPCCNKEYEYHLVSPKDINVVAMSSKHGSRMLPDYYTECPDCGVLKFLCR